MKLHICRSLFILLFFLVSGCALNPVTGESELALVRLSQEEEVRLGKSAYLQAIQQYGGRYQNDDLQRYVDQVGQRLARRSHRPGLPFTFTLINDSSPNAFALPGGYIAITRGLLGRLSNEAELAAVLGHEIAHVTLRHSLQGMQRNALLGTTFGLLGELAESAGYGALTSPLGGLVQNLIDKRYSRGQETESDRIGIDYMVRAGYDPRGAIQLQEFFAREVEQGANSDWLKGLFRSHPFSTQRLAANRRYIAERYPQPVGDGQDAGAYADAITPLIQTRQGYATYDQGQSVEKSGDLAAAIRLYHQALLEAPDEPLILGALGMAYLRREDLVPARRYLLKAIQLQTDYYRTRLGLGYIYLQKKQAKSAREQLESGFKLLPTLEGAFLLAEAREETADLVGARKLYTAVAKADPQGQLGQRAALRLKQLGP